MAALVYLGGFEKVSAVSCYMELRLLRVTRSVRLSSEVTFGNKNFFCKTRVVSLSFFYVE